MLGRFRNLVAVLLIGDLVLTQLALYLSAVARREIELGQYIPPEQSFYSVLLHVIVLLIWAIVFVSFGVYDTRRMTMHVGEARVLVTAELVAVFAFAGVLYLSFRDVPRLMIFYFLLIDLFLLALLRVIVGVTLRYRQARGYDLAHVLIVGANDVGKAVAEALDSEVKHGLVRVGFCDDEPQPCCQPVWGRVEDVYPLVKHSHIEEVIVALPSVESRRIEALVRELQTLPVRIRIVPDFFRLAMAMARVEDLSGIPLVGIREPLIQGSSWVIKRTFDLVLSAIALFLLWPFMLVIAVAIKLDSSGAVLFRQQRVGENGRLFWMYKFRTMIEGADKEVSCQFVPAEGGMLAPVYKRQCDPRVTRLGRFLRRTSLDELPQLFNVFTGEMSLVGPRPEQAFIVDGYEPWQRQRLVVPPGVTGWWQVSGRSELPMHLNTEYDLFYIRNYSLWLDVQILWRTVGAVIRGRGAY